jgi:hypothetical protein
MKTRELENPTPRHRSRSWLRRAFAHRAVRRKSAQDSADIVKRATGGGDQPGRHPEAYRTEDMVGWQSGVCPGIRWSSRPKAASVSTAVSKMRGDGTKSRREPARLGTDHVGHLSPARSFADDYTYCRQNIAPAMAEMETGR